MKPIMLTGLSIMIIAILVSAVAFISQRNEYPAKHAEVVLRDIGHQLLHSAKDSTSRVLPVRKLDENTYQLSFQNDFSFVSDSLINIVQRTFQANTLASGYIVNLRNCGQNETVLAFEIHGKSADLTPCRGRTLELGCYVVEIDLLSENRSNFLWLLLLVIPLGFAGVYLKNKVQQKEVRDAVLDAAESIQIGNFRFYPANNVLKNGHGLITLSEKETKALEIFARNINQVVEREKLMKEIWEDEGTVVISRNVDVLVSKLRKKLSGDNALKFITVHGRGYKFTIE